MPFGLKNAGAPYQRLVNRRFKDQIGCDLEVYIDDMLVKSTSMGEHVRNLSETFAILRAYGMKLNLEKCAFRVRASRFLANPSPESTHANDNPKSWLVYIDGFAAKTGSGARALIIGPSGNE
ncbi:RNA-directed DNA polymerase-like protein [Gossypium australe]|uniref:RNA-directed DNA polymerase-like protein n=1 Tax=Gossypium australe TaxID=47621 RepID=A0A5B6VA83_9ROSI|nr:RNA-directed DNA polymerase-like protein [Gossypium australe]